MSGGMGSVVGVDVFHQVVLHHILSLLPVPLGIEEIRHLKNTNSEIRDSFVPLDLCIVCPAVTNSQHFSVILGKCFLV